MIRFGIIGTNWITEKFLEAAMLLPDFKLNAVFSRTEEKAKSFAGKFHAPHTYTSVEEMADSGEIDAVYIASPNSLHAEQAILCMERGIHVLCEKPLASNAREVEAMIQTARKHDVLLMEALKTTFIPNFRVIQEHLPKIGPIRRYSSSYCQYSSRYDAYKEGTILNAFNPKFSNGALMDIGIYCLYPLLALFGEPERMQAAGTMLESGVDGQGTISFQYDTMEAVIQYSKITDSHAPTEIQGEYGNIVIDKISSPSDVKIIYRDGRTENLSVPQQENTMYYEAAEFIHLLKSGKKESAINTFALSLQAAKIMEAARKQIGIQYPADSHS